MNQDLTTNITFEGSKIRNINLDEVWIFTLLVAVSHLFISMQGIL